MPDFAALQGWRALLAVVPLGYVGLVQKFRVLGFGIAAARMEQLQRGIDHTGEVAAKDLANPRLSFSSRA